MRNWIARATHSFFYGKRQPGWAVSDNTFLPDTRPRELAEEWAYACAMVGYNPPPSLEDAFEAGWNTREGWEKDYRNPFAPAPDTQSGGRPDALTPFGERVTEAFDEWRAPPDDTKADRAGSPQGGQG